MRLSPKTDMKGDIWRAVPKICHHVNKAAYNLLRIVPYALVLLYVSVIHAFSLSRSISFYRCIIGMFNSSIRYLCLGFLLFYLNIDTNKSRKLFKSPRKNFFISHTYRTLIEPTFIKSLSCAECYSSHFPTQPYQLFL